ncbi:MAG: Kelch repeat-containing protein, partial [Candidatus Hodarchaeales archaeon]
IILALLIIIVCISTVDTKVSYSTITSPQEENKWINMSPTAAPEPRNDFKAVYDVKADKIIIFSGLHIFVRQYQDTWSYDFNTNTWTNMSSENIPQERVAYSVAYDEESDRTILFGGLKTDLLTRICWRETWSFNYDTNAWNSMDPSLQPPGRAYADMVYDKGSDRIIMFGGVSENTMYADTWAYNFNTNEWINMTPSIQPSPRWGHRMTYNAESDRIILFGGSKGLPPNPVAVRDTWLYDYDTNTWSNKTPTTSPPELLNHGLTYDVKSDRVILYGGADSNLINQGETWIYDINTNSWSNKTLNTSLEPRRRFGMCYDKESDQTILFGGCFDDFTPTDETWAYNFQTDEELESTTTKPRWYIPSFTLELGLISLVIFAKQVKRRSTIKKEKRTYQN